MKGVWTANGAKRLDHERRETAREARKGRVWSRGRVHARALSWFSRSFVPFVFQSFAYRMRRLDRKHRETFGPRNDAKVGARFRVVRVLSRVSCSKRLAFQRSRARQLLEAIHDGP